MNHITLYRHCSSCHTTETLTLADAPRDRREGSTDRRERPSLFFERVDRRTGPLSRRYLQFESRKHGQHTDVLLFARNPVGLDSFLACWRRAHQHEVRQTFQDDTQILPLRRERGHVAS